MGICDCDKYLYIMTYSFPCQDLSRAGKMLGMDKGGGTRSGMLWQVERLLDELKETNSLPQMLLMENVPDVVGQKNISNFASWLAKLERLGYKCSWQVLNSSDFGVPQNRDRCFMVSILGDYYYDFPQKYGLKKVFLDLLEKNVDEKFFLSDKAIDYIIDNDGKTIGTKWEDKIQSGVLNPKIAHTVSVRSVCGLQRASVSNYILDGVDKEIKFKDLILSDEFGKGLTLKEKLCDVIKKSGIVKAGDIINHSYTNGLCGKNPNSRQSVEDFVEATNGVCICLTTRPDTMGVVVEQNGELRIRKPTPRECFRLMGVYDKDFDKLSAHQSNMSLYHLSGDSIVTMVLCAIFGQMLENFDFEKVIDKFYKQMGE